MKLTDAQYIEWLAALGVDPQTPGLLDAFRQVAEEAIKRDPTILEILPEMDENEANQ